MHPEAIEQVTEVPATKNMSGAKVKNAKKVVATAKPCIYFPDVECRAPVCDMEVCQRCPEGHGFCSRTLLLKRMIQRVLMFLVALLFFSDM